MQIQINDYNKDIPKKKRKNTFPFLLNLEVEDGNALKCFDF